MVTLLPPEAGGQWRFPWEAAWRDSGSTAGNLAEGEYAVEFRSAPGFLAVPLSGPVAVTNGGTTFLTNQYYPTIIPSDATGGSGSLTVNIGPSPPGGAGWRFLGDTNAYYPPGYSTNLLAGTYLIEFAPVARLPPLPRSPFKSSRVFRRYRWSPICSPPPPRPEFICPCRFRPATLVI